MSEEKVLILTGCAGFIGLNFLKLATNQKLCDYYDVVYCIDKIGYASKYNVEEYNKFCKCPFKGYIRQVNKPVSQITGSCLSGMKNASYDVLSFASESHVDRSIASPLSVFMENAAIPGHIMNALSGFHIRKWIHISTDEVYGDLPLDAKYEDWFNVNSNFHPNNPYSASKAAQDCYLMSMKHTFGINVQFIRLANEFGPYQHPEKMLPATILRAIRGETVKIYGDGTNIRQWTPVRSAVEVIYDQLLKEDTETILIAKKYYPLINNNEVVHIWKEILNKKYNIDFNIEYITDRLGHDTMYALQTTSYVDKFFTASLESEFESTIDHYMENKEHYLDLK